MSTMSQNDQQRGYPQPQNQRGNGLAIASLVCGIIGLFLLNIILGPLAIIFGGVGLHKANNGAKHKGIAIAGLILGVIDVAIFVILIAVASSNGGSVYWHVGG